MSYNKEKFKAIRDCILKINELKDWFILYDIQVAQYNRCVRLGEEFDKDINELDAQAKQNASKIKELKAEIERLKK